MTLDFASKCALNDVIYVSFFTLGLWNLHRVYLKWEVGRRFPYKLLLVIAAQTFASLVFVLGPILLTAFVTVVQAFSWIFFVIVHVSYLWKVYHLENELLAADPEAAKRLAAEKERTPAGCLKPEGGVVA